MLAFHNNQKIKDMYAARVRAHTEADEITQGRAWDRAVWARAVDCTMHGLWYSPYEAELGIPRQIAHLQERIFYELSLAEAKTFPLAFLTAIPVGADLSLVLAHFMVWLLSDPEYGTQRFCSEQGKQTTEAVVALYRRVIAGETIPVRDWRATRRAPVYSGVDPAAAAADDAADAGVYAAAADSAEARVAVYGLAAAAVYLAKAADCEADGGGASAAANAAAAVAGSDSAERQKHFGRMRDKLLSLLQEAPVPTSR